MPRFLVATFSLILLASGSPSHADGKTDSLVPADEVYAKARIVFPDIPGYLTITSDLHTHSVFSDGHVWPNVRVAEAEREGLDVLAITEHLEWQPHLSDIPHPDRNRAYDIAIEAASGGSVMVLPGAEITRELPAGHINAIFIKDANQLMPPDDYEYDQQSVDQVLQQYPDSSNDSEDSKYYLLKGLWPVDNALAEVRKQGGFAFWNHPSWSSQAPGGIPAVSEHHKRWFKQGLVHGIEIANGKHYSPESFQLALDYGLTMIGTSDVHELIDWDYPPSLNQHRPVTLIFSKTREPESLKQALMQGRTVVWHRDSLLGRKDFLEPLLQASLKVENAHYKDGTKILEMRLRNVSSVTIGLENISEYGDQTHAGTVRVPALGFIDVQLATPKKEKRLDWLVRVSNAFAEPGVAVDLTLTVTPAL